MTPPLIAGVLAVVLALAAGAAPTYSVTEHIAGPDGGWDLAAVDPGAHRLYIARGTGVQAVDLASGRVTPGLVPLVRGHGVLPVPGTDRVIATSGGTGTAVLFEGGSGRVIATIPVGKNPDAVAYDPATRTVWVMNPGSQDASVVDPATGVVVATVPIGGSLELGVADGRGRLYVNVEDRNEVVVLDTRARKVLAHYPLNGCDGPTGIAYSERAGLILSACANGVAKVTAPDGRDVATLKIGPRPDGAAFDEARQLALVPSGGDGTLSVIRLSPRPEVVATVLTAVGARTLALDASTGAVYLPSARYGTAPAKGRPPVLPGSFAVLVVKPSSAP